VTSVYRWEGAIAEDRESLLVIKTTAELVGEATLLVKQIHAYSVPEVIALALADGEGNADYLSWLRESVGPQKPGE
jgi:periplasmic divalent cation tolerance protein